MNILVDFPKISYSCLRKASTRNSISSRTFVDKTNAEYFCSYKVHVITPCLLFQSIVIKQKFKPKIKAPRFAPSEKFWISGFFMKKRWEPCVLRVEVPSAQLSPVSFHVREVCWDPQSHTSQFHLRSSIQLLQSICSRVVHFLGQKIFSDLHLVCCYLCKINILCEKFLSTTLFDLV